ncbi:hypothetical protein ABZ923_39855 [Streptomyces sp. NPDC046881]|uniref:hypothetical protein n=1 Tax=Streptomyces sp. NPDC046881 TaxID=3155374 RepID=UPI003403AC63
MDVRLATCTYQEFTPDMGTPVRTTVGRPRFPLPYPLTAHARLVTPTKELLSINAADAYEFSYRRLLNERGFDAIQAELIRIAGAYDLDSPLVLLCFDQYAKLTPPNCWCHRMFLAKWITEHTGQEVPELGAPPKTADHQQGGLF